MSEFRRQLDRVADWIVRYRETIRERRVLPDVTPGQIRAKLPKTAPARGEPFEEILNDFDRVIAPGMTHWNHPRFFAYFTANNSEPSILAEALTAAIGAQCMSWQTSPAATELEQVVMEWLRSMLELPEKFAGVIQDTASTATLVAILMARERATNFRFKEEGVGAEGADRLRVYASEEAHSSIDKGVLLSGIGRKNLVKIPVDSQFALRQDALVEAVSADRKKGLIPACVIATVGTTGSTAVDPLPEIGKFCRDENIFLHVDAAFAGSAALLPELRHILNGVEFADAFLFNPHKWLYTNFDCTAFFVKDPDLLVKTCGITPEYLKTQYDPEVVNFRDWGLQLGRRFRALKLWFVLRSMGQEGIRARIREAIRLGGLFRKWVEDQGDFEILAPSPFSLVCFRYAPKGTDEMRRNMLNEKLLGDLNRTGKIYLSHTKLNGRFTLRLNASQERTTEEDVRRAWDLIRTTARRL
ncbi:MAG: pyridoxal-dependent decarboxylase [Pseudomonadota bacterium]